MSVYELKHILSNLGSGGTGNGTPVDLSEQPGKMPTSLIIEVLAAIGATPTSTNHLEGSVDGTNYFQLAYKTPSSDTPSTANITITAAGRTYYYLHELITRHVRFIRWRISANTNVDLDVTAYIGA